MKTIVRRALITFSAALIAVPFCVMAQPMPKTTKESVPGQAQVKTEQLSGTVLFVEGNKLAVRMSSGEVRNFDVPGSRRFNIDGKELTVDQLQPGTKLNATVTTTTTPITDRTTTVGTGKVWFVSGNTVILTLPNNENRSYKVTESYRFNVDGRPASVHDLRKGMTIAAQKIVEEPRVEIASDTTVTGHAPPPPAPVTSTRPTTVAHAAPAPVPAPAAAPKHHTAEAAPAPAEAPEELPKTGSVLPLIGMVGFALTAGSLGLRIFRRA